MSIAAFCFLTIVLTGQNHQLSLSDIAKANERAWESVYSVDMTFEVTTTIVENGKETARLSSQHCRWSQKGSLERLRMPIKLINMGANKDEELPEGMEDYFLDGQTVHYLTGPESPITEPLSVCEQRGLSGHIAPQTSQELVGRRPELLRHIRFLGVKDCITLSVIVASWKTTLKEKPLKDDSGDVLWCIHAEYPPKNAEDPRSGSYVDIYVNANKGFMVQKLSFYDCGAARDKSGQYVPIVYLQEVKEFHNCGNGIFFPKLVTFVNFNTADPPHTGDGFFETIRTTKLVVNEPLGEEAFDFRFPENLIVRRLLPDGSRGAMMLWGADNKPSREFHTHDEFEEYAKETCGKGQ